MKISVILIVKNECARVESCLKSVAWADEIIVLDSNSSDDTVAICKKYTPHVEVTDWPGFGIQKNRALSKATGEWVLSLDADECVSEALHQEIVTVLSAPCEHVAYVLPRVSSHMGKILRYGDWAHDHCVRLFRRGQAAFTPDIIHERLTVLSGTIGRLKNPLLHQTFVSLEQVLEKVNRYSTLGAQMRAQQGQRGSLSKAIVRAFWTFFRGYFLKRGFLDGQEGFLLAVSNAEGVYYRYVKMMYLKQG